MACSDALDPQRAHGQHDARLPGARRIRRRAHGDCKSLYGHIQREGTPKAPTEKRLALDLASIRQLLITEAKHQWRRRFGSDCEPSPEHGLAASAQLADVLTKRMLKDLFWNALDRGFLATFSRAGPRA